MKIKYFNLPMQIEEAFYLWYNRMTNWKRGWMMGKIIESPFLQSMLPCWHQDFGSWRSVEVFCARVDRPAITKLRASMKMHVPTKDYHWSLLGTKKIYPANQVFLHPLSHWSVLPVSKGTLMIQTPHLWISFQILLLLLLLRLYYAAYLK